MRLVDSVSIIVAKLLYDLLDLFKFFSCSEISNDTLKTVNFVSLVLNREGFQAYSRAPTFRLSYSLSFKARWML